MEQRLTIEDIEKLSQREHLTAEELDLLVARTRELNIAHQHAVDRLKGILERIEARLQQAR